MPQSGVLQTLEREKSSPQRLPEMATRNCWSRRISKLKCILGWESKLEDVISCSKIDEASKLSMTLL